MKTENIVVCQKNIKNCLSSTWTLLLQEFGSSTIEVEQLEITLIKGYICIIPPKQPYSVKMKDNDAIILLEARDFRPFGDSRTFILHDDDDNLTINIANLILNEWSKRAQNIHRAVINSLTDALYHALAGIYAKDEMHDFRIESMLNVMYENISNCDFNVGECINLSGYSKGYFRKLFKQMTGTSPVQFMNRIRIDFAKTQFEQFGDSKSIKEISYESGFADQLYFSRLFRKQVGISPREYVNDLYCVNDNNKGKL